MFALFIGRVRLTVAAIMVVFRLYILSLYNRSPLLLLHVTGDNTWRQRSRDKQDEDERKPIHALSLLLLQPLAQKGK